MERERKKNFPTKEKVEEKAVERAVLKERGEVMWLKREKLRQEERERRGETEEKKEPEAEWECNCKARHFVRNLRGRGRGRGRNWSVPRNIKHQGHCRELELIRERAKEKREKRQAIWEEKKEKRKRVDGEQEQKTEHVVKKVKVERVEDVDSCSEDEGWNGGLWKFAGTKNMLIEQVKMEEISFNLGVNAYEDETEVEIESKLEIKIDADLKQSEPIDTSDDEAPEEVKTLVSYENVVEETENLTEVKAEKKQRKRKKKVNEDSKLEAISQENHNSTEVSNSFSKSYDDSNPPIPGEDNPEPDEFSQPQCLSTITSHQSTSKPSATVNPPKVVRPNVFDQRMRPPTLLEKLLLNEIKKERNKILQCVRFVCKNNFFQETDPGPGTK